MDHMRLHPARPQPARQPEAVPTSFEGQCNPRNLAAGLDRLVTPAMQQAKQPFCTRLQLLAWLALNAGKHTGNQPTRLVQNLARNAARKGFGVALYTTVMAGGPTISSGTSVTRDVLLYPDQGP